MELLIYAVWVKWGQMGALQIIRCWLVKLTTRGLDFRAWKPHAEWNKSDYLKLKQMACLLIRDTAAKDYKARALASWQYFHVPMDIMWHFLSGLGDLTRFRLLFGPGANDCWVRHDLR